MNIEQILNELTSELSVIDKSLEEINQLTIEITEIPAPPFKESIRGNFIENYFLDLDYDTEIDEVGNVLAYMGTKNKKVILSAHLDTVFDNSDIKVIEDGVFLKAPGVGDDSRGLANLLIIAKLLKNSTYSQKILFVATVGEEGLGDLRGVKHLFKDKNLKAHAFITIDGTGSSRIVDQGIGSLRYRLWIRGPGGHSFGSFGTVNPIFCLGNFTTLFSQMKVVDGIKSTYSLGVIKGGTSINAIPEQVFVDIDLRSESIEGLQKMDNQVKSFIQQSVDLENSARIGSITFELEKVGNRPPGKLHADSKLRDIVFSVNEFFDIEVNFTASSTDANVPQNLNIPAISVAGVENSGRAHTQDEWIEADLKSLEPIKRNMLLVCSVANHFVT